MFINCIQAREILGFKSSAPLYRFVVKGLLTDHGSTKVGDQRHQYKFELAEVQALANGRASVKKTSLAGALKDVVTVKTDCSLFTEGITSSHDAQARINRYRVEAIADAPPPLDPPATMPPTASQAISSRLRRIEEKLDALIGMLS